MGSSLPDISRLTISERADFKLPAGINMRNTPLPILTERVSETSVRPLAEGGYSNVWQGTLDKKLVAIKCLRDLPVQEEKAQRWLRREIGVWWCLLHENIAPLFGIMYDAKFGKSPAMVSPWYENGAASSYLDPKRSISVSQRVKLFHGVARGIHYLHTVDEIMPAPRRGIKLVHGDLKPPNVLVDDDGHAKICDFGLLRLVRDSTPTGMTTTSGHTGSTRYLSCELVSDDDDNAKPTTASDVWALACIGFEFIYAKPPHATIPDTKPNATFKIMGAIEKGLPPATRSSDCTGTISGLWDLFEACWNKEPSKRPEAAVVCRFLDDNGELLIAELEK